MEQNLKHHKSCNSYKAGKPEAQLIRKAIKYCQFKKQVLAGRHASLSIGFWEKDG